MGWPIPYAEPGVDGRPPRRPTGAQAAVLAARARLRRPGRRRLAVLDTHLPWRISGFRDAEFRELVRRRPDSLAFTLHRTTDPFPTPVHELADFPALAARAGVTDVYLVFLNFACDVLGLADEARAAGVGGLRRDLSLAPELHRYGIRVHATLHPGGGLLPDTPVELLRAVQARTATLFSYDQRVLDLLPGAISCPVPLDVACFAPAPRPHDGVVRLVFAGGRPAAQGPAHAARRVRAHRARPARRPLPPRPGGPRRAPRAGARQPPSDAARLAAARRPRGALPPLRRRRGARHRRPPRGRRGRHRHGRRLPLHQRPLGDGDRLPAGRLQPGRRRAARDRRARLPARAGTRSRGARGRAARAARRRPAVGRDRAARRRARAGALRRPGRGRPQAARDGPGG